MQRQSLGSPISKLHGHGGSAIAVARDDAIIEEDTKRRDSFSSSSLIGEYDDEDSKAVKLHRLSTSPLSPLKPEKFIHLIPILTLLCFLTLYLCSHSPSQSDLAQFNGFNRSPNRIAAAGSTKLVEDIGGLNELHKGDVLAIRSLRNLQEIDKRPSRSSYGRKLGDF